MAQNFLGITACIGSRSRSNSPVTHCKSSNRKDLQGRKTVYDGENYLWILECLDGGKFS